MSDDNVYEELKLALESKGYSPEEIDRMVGLARLTNGERA